MMSAKAAKKAHLKTIKAHRKEVRKWCFKMGIPLQGLKHDLSKYSRYEMAIARWYTGDRSPHDNARDELGYSPSWWHHKGLNKHHWEMFTDWNAGSWDENGKFVVKMVPVKMPYRYVIEMFCDYIGAGRVYAKEKWTQDTPLQYHLKTRNNRCYHDETEGLFYFLCTNLSKMGVKNFLKFYKSHKHTIKDEYENGGFKNSETGYKKVDK